MTSDETKKITMEDLDGELKKKLKEDKILFKPELRKSLNTWGIVIVILGFFLTSKLTMLLGALCLVIKNRILFLIIGIYYFMAAIKYTAFFGFFIYNVENTEDIRKQLDMLIGGPPYLKLGIVQIAITAPCIIIGVMAIKRYKMFKTSEGGTITSDDILSTSSGLECRLKKELNVWGACLIGYIPILFLLSLLLGGLFAMYAAKSASIYYYLVEIGYEDYPLFITCRNMFLWILYLIKYNYREGNIIKLIVVTLCYSPFLLNIIVPFLLGILCYIRRSKDTLKYIGRVFIFLGCYYAFMYVLTGYVFQFSLGGNDGITKSYPIIHILLSTVNIPIGIVAIKRFGRLKDLGETVATAVSGTAGHAYVSE